MEKIPRNILAGIGKIANSSMGKREKETSCIIHGLSVQLSQEYG
jgi:hypothetical protein